MEMCTYRSSSYKEIIEACLITLSVNIPWHILGIWQEALDFASLNPDGRVTIIKFKN